MSFTGGPNVNAPEADCEYANKRLHFSQMSKMGFKVEVTDPDTSGRIAVLAPSLLHSRADIELPSGSRYLAIKKGVLHIKLEISDEHGRKLCELKAEGLESTDYCFEALGLRSSDPDPILLAILSLYSHELIGYPRMPDAKHL